MPRGERPLDEGDSPLLLFAADLRKLRTNAGNPSYRELSRRAHFSSTTLSDAAGGRKLPGLDVTLAYVRACHGDEAAWEQRWHDLAVLLARTRVKEGPSPYVGLKAFETDDADRFFGREALTHALLTRLESRSFLAVFGASGEGKSSLLRAGIAPKFDNAVICTPGRDPDATIHEALARHPDLLVVDQFEELFTLCEDEVRRRAFLDAFLAADCRKVIAIRSDFYPHCAEHPDLAEALTDNQVLLGAMTPDEMRRAITQPAATAGCTVESALLSTLIAEATGRSGVLPLVSHALLETWHRRRGNTLTLAGYQAAGGIHGALAQSAEAVYASLPDDQQRQVRQLLLRLSSDGAKRPIPRSEVVGEEVLEALASARLITVDEDTVAVTHEALFRAWPRLKAWLEEDREGLHTHRRLTEAARLWIELGRDAGALYRTTRLAAAIDWEERSQPELSGTERDFLSASKKVQRRRSRRLRWAAAGLSALLVATSTTAVVAFQQRERAEELSLIAQSRELATMSEAMMSSNPRDAAAKAAQAYRTYPTAEARSQLLSTVASRQERRLAHDGDVYSFTVDDQRIGLMGPNGLRLYHPNMFVLNGSVPKPPGDGQVFAWARAANQRGLAMAETTGRISTWTDFDAKPVVLREAGPRAGVRFLDGDRALLVGGTVWDLQTRQVRFELPIGPLDGPFAVSEDEQHAAFVNGAEVALWDLRTRQKIGGHALPPGADRISSVRLLPGGTHAVITTNLGIVQIRNLVTGELVATPPSFTGVVSGSVDDGGKVLVLSGYDERRIVLWDIATSSVITSFTDEDNVFGAGFLPDGSLAYLTSTALKIKPAAGLRRASGYAVKALTVDPDGAVLTLDESGTLERRDAQLRSQSRVETGVAQHAPGRFSPDGKRVVTTGPLVVRDVATGKPVTELTAPGFPAAKPPKSLAYQGNSVLAVGSDAPNAVWTVDGEATSKLIGGMPAFSDGADLATFGRTDHELVIALSNKEVFVRDIATWQDKSVIFEGFAPTRAMAVSPDKRLLATGDANGQIFLYDTATWQQIDILNGHSASISALEFSPDSTRLASGSADKSVIVWELVEGNPWAKLRGHDQGVTHVTWRPGGGAVVSAAGNEVPIVWSLDADKAMQDAG